MNIKYHSLVPFATFSPPTLQLKSLQLVHNLDLKRSLYRTFYNTHTSLATLRSQNNHNLTPQRIRPIRSYVKRIELLSAQSIMPQPSQNSCKILVVMTGMFREQQR